LGFELSIATLGDRVPSRVEEYHTTGQRGRERDVIAIFAGARKVNDQNKGKEMCF